MKHLRGRHHHHKGNAKTLGFFGDLTKLAKLIASVFTKENSVYTGVTKKYLDVIDSVNSAVKVADIVLASQISINNDAGKQAATVGGFTCVNTFQDAAKATFSKVYVNEAKKSLIISFRGTVMNDPVDWATNLKLDLVGATFGSAAVGKVHSGFLAEYMVDREKIKAVIASYDKKFGGIKEIQFYGHSQGGALAQLCAVDYSVAQKKGSPLVKVITFGEPRVGDATFAATSDRVISTLVRVTHTWKDGSAARQDVVPIALPVQFGFRHSGLQLEVPCQDKDFLKCHKMAGYITSLKQ